MSKNEAVDDLPEGLYETLIDTALAARLSSMTSDHVDARSLRDAAMVGE